jgi:hypothetical protein
VAVAVAGWQWRLGGLFKKKLLLCVYGTRGACGSGRVAVIRMALDRGDRGGHFGANLVAWLWLGRWLGGSGDWADFF